MFKSQIKILSNLFKYFVLCFRRRKSEKKKAVEFTKHYIQTTNWRNYKQKNTLKKEHWPTRTREINQDEFK